MKDIKKQRGMKAQIRAYKERSRYIATVVTVVILVAIIAIIGFLIYSYLKPSTPSPTAQLKAAIVDHLSLTAPNPSFNQTVTSILEAVNYTVDYYPGEEVDVEFYRNLPTHDYDLIILRVHSALRDPEGRPLVFFTSQNYSTEKYVPEQVTDRIVPVAYNPEEAKEGILYFGITPKFVEQDMKGRFRGTTIIMMGCNGLTYIEMAKALIYRGAKVYIGWSQAVSASHTDNATIQLLEHLITENQTIKDAVGEISPDLSHNSKLDYFPKTPQVENYVIPKVKSNLTTNVAEINPKMEKLKDKILNEV
ncbi:MAG: hypothetical protein ACUVRA_06135 [Candidatus Bathyarchaeaceae archaeon]